VAKPRIARFLSVRPNSRGVVLTGKIIDGPRSEIGKPLHLALTPDDAAGLRLALTALEVKDDC